jgi:hypothetical protein
MGSAKLLDGTG